MADLKWYVLRAVSGQEKKVKGYLENEIARQNLSDYVPELVIPAEKVYQMRNGKKKMRERSYFPGYILVSADLNHGEVFHLFNTIPGVIGFLGANGKSTDKMPVPLRPSEVNRFLGKTEEGEEDVTTVNASFLKGETIKVMDGPFNGFTGTIEEVFDEKKKLNVTDKIFGRNTPVELNFMQVEKIQ